MLPNATGRIKTAGIILAAALVLAGVGFRASSSTERDGLAFTRGNLIRLHIIANSDSLADQRVKLLVRDDLIKEAKAIFLAAKDAGRARRQVLENVASFRRIAERRLRAEGFAYPVRVEYGVFPFPDRTYGDLTLPAGKYNAVRVILGEGKGHNWWCVLFPPLCFLQADSELVKGRVVRRPAPVAGQVAVRFRVALPGAPGQPAPLSVLIPPLVR
ncbi:MAG: stage II sporulation protein R [Chitinophagales bacterium]